MGLQEVAGRVTLADQATGLALRPGADEGCVVAGVCHGSVIAAPICLDQRESTSLGRGLPDERPGDGQRQQYACDEFQHRCQLRSWSVSFP
jgi:hypothetical protein